MSERSVTGRELAEALDLQYEILSILDTAGGHDASEDALSVLTITPGVRTFRHDGGLFIYAVGSVSRWSAAADGSSMYRVEVLCERRLGRTPEYDARSLATFEQLRAEAALTW